MHIALGIAALLYLCIGTILSGLWMGELIHPTTRLRVLLCVFVIHPLVSLTWPLVFSGTVLEVCEEAYGSKTWQFKHYTLSIGWPKGWAGLWENFRIIQYETPHAWSPLFVWGLGFGIGVLKKHRPGIGDFPIRPCTACSTFVTYGCSRCEGTPEAPCYCVRKDCKQQKGHIECHECDDGADAPAPNCPKCHGLGTLPVPPPTAEDLVILAKARASR